jgi:hypothetical protein
VSRFRKYWIVSSANPFGMANLLASLFSYIMYNNQIDRRSIKCNAKPFIVGANLVMILCSRTVDSTVFVFRNRKHNNAAHEEVRSLRF